MASLSWFINDPDQSLSKIKEILRYEPDTGKFFWVKTVGPAKKGTEAGGLNNHGYVRIRVFGKKVFAHRLAWLFSYGEWPTDELDHVNAIRDDNRINNLRVADRSKNSHRAKKTLSSSGFRGVYEHPQKMHTEKRWMARASRKHIGLYSSPEEAYKAYCDFVEKTHGEFSWLK